VVAQWSPAKMRACQPDLIVDRDDSLNRPNSITELQKIGDSCESGAGGTFERRMQNTLHKLVSRLLLLPDQAAGIPTNGPNEGSTPENSQRGEQLYVVQTLVIVIPRLHNSDTNGRRRVVAPDKIEETKNEIKHLFSGYSMFFIEGWYRDRVTGQQISDPNILFEVDAAPEEFNVEYLRSWRRTLESRFEQCSIHMRLSSPARLL
jgi:hypothetical protein